ncbi:MAG: D-tyrosyl-tRNA(Tyr) deacylase [Clostridia bacterium]|nr:D-tyrosyl-tRNA(Tyr) deacylase [Clostridia bacterium]
MIAVLQRVKRAAVAVDGKTVGACDNGLCILLGVAKGDSEEDARALAQKIVDLRIFTDENDKMNLSLKDVDGEALVVSNFTLLAAYKKGKRPDYYGAAAPDEADRLYEYFCSLVDGQVKHVGRGIFGADMEISMVCDGPVTIVMDSNVLLGKKESDGKVK